jgi:hypothetical protein
VGQKRTGYSLSRGFFCLSLDAISAASFIEAQSAATTNPIDVFIVSRITGYVKPDKNVHSCQEFHSSVVYATGGY